MGQAGPTDTVGQAGPMDTVGQAGPRGLKKAFAEKKREKVPVAKHWIKEAINTLQKCVPK